MELALTGRLDFPAERAHHFGLVNVLCEEGEALEAAKALAAQITEDAPLAVRESREIVLEATDQPDEVGWKMSGDGHGQDVRHRGLQRGPAGLRREARAAVEG